MKILMLSIDNSICDTSSTSYKRMKALSALVDKLDIVVLKNASEEKIENENLRIFSSPHSQKFHTYFWAKKICREKCEKEKYDVVTSQDPFHLGKLALRLGKDFGAGVELQLHGDFFSNEYWQKEKPLNKLLIGTGLKNLKKADAIRVVSRRIRDDLIIRGIEAERIYTVPIFVDWQFLQKKDPKFSLKEKYPQFEFIALSLGRLEWVKNIDFLIQAWAEHVKNSKNDGLIIVGDGSEKESLIKLIEELGIKDNVIFEPATDDVASYYRGADCFILTSRYEGWGRTVVESLACECPIIMTDVGCAGEVVRNGENGIVVPVEDRSALVEAINKIKRPEIRKAFQEKSNEYLEKLPSAEETQNLYLESWKKAEKK